MKIGDRVTYHFWTEGELRSAPATVTEIFRLDPIYSYMYDDDGNVIARKQIGTMPQALALVVDLTDEVMEREGYVREQSHSRQRAREEDDIHTSGTWSP